MSSDAAKYERFPDTSVGLRRFRDPADGSPGLLCIPYAGGQSLAFRPLAQHFPQDWGVWAIDPPGHGWAGGAPLVDVDEMVSVYLSCLPEATFSEIVLLGHSLGGCVAYAMAVRLVSQGTPPRALVLSATRPPHRKDDYDSFAKMDDKTLLDVLIEIGGVPSQWADEPDVFDHFKEALRADFASFEAFQISGQLVSLPVMAFGGMEDKVCLPEHLFEWSRYCPGCRVDFIAGDHLFLQTNPAPMAQRIASFVETTVSPREAPPR